MLRLAVAFKRLFHERDFYLLSGIDQYHGTVGLVGMLVNNTIFFFIFFVLYLGFYVFWVSFISFSGWWDHKFNLKIKKRESVWSKHGREMKKITSLWKNPTSESEPARWWVNLSTTNPLCHCKVIVGKRWLCLVAKFCGLVLEFSNIFFWLKNPSQNIFFIR